MTIRALYNRLFQQGSERTIKAKKNVFLMSFYKGLSILVSLLLIPITLDYVNSETYGIWLTLSSVVGWISFFDIGINNGLKNRLTEALANNNLQLGKVYVSTTYAMLTIIFVPLLIILLLIIPQLSWESMLNITIEGTENLIVAMCIIATYFCFNFILTTINVVIFAHQAPAQASLCTLCQQVVTLIVIYILTLSTQGSLINLCLGLCLSPIIVLFIYNLIFFKRNYKDLSPSIKDVDFKKLPDILKLGIKFFIIQIAGVVQFQMVNFLIIRNFGAEEVTSYNIANKYFSILYMIWGILITPVWAAVTDAMMKKDFSWIRNMQRRYLKLFLLFTLCGFIMLFMSPLAYNIWIGDKVIIGVSLSVWLLIYNLVLMYSSIYVNTLNGLGVLNIQTIACCVSPIVFLLLTKLFINLGFGVEAIIIGSILANVNGFLLAPIQCKTLVKSKEYL